MSTKSKNPGKKKISAKDIREYTYLNYLFKGYNQSESYRQAYNTNNITTSNVEGSRLLTRDSVQEKIHELLDMEGVGVRDRVRMIGKIITGQYISEEITYKVIPDETDTETGYKSIPVKKIQRLPTPSEITKSIELVNKMEDFYNRVKAQTKNDSLIDETMKNEIKKKIKSLD